MNELNIKKEEFVLKSEIKVEDEEIFKENAEFFEHDNDWQKSEIGIKSQNPDFVQFEITEIRETVEGASNEIHVPEPGNSKTPEYKCFYCDKHQTFNHPRYLSQHINTSHPGFPREYSGCGPIHCKICYEICGGVESLSRHVETKHPEAKDELRFECYHCGSKWKFLSGLRKHMTAHMNDKSFQCEICLKTFKNKDYMDNHKKIVHTTEKCFQCPECYKFFKSKPHLRSHRLSHRNTTGQKNFNCDQCDKVFQTSSGVYYHVANHHKKKTFRCTKCPKAFGLKNQLKDHLLSHSDIRPFECPICKKKFKVQKSMTTHVEMHNFEVETNDEDQAEKQHKCSVCKKGFKRPYELKVHAVVHQTEAKFKCEHCPRTFKSKQQLKNHIDSFHSGGGACSFCGKIFPGHLSLKRHENKQHKKSGYFFNCHLCPLVYKRKILLLTHLTTDHNMATEDAVNRTENMTTVPVKQEVDEKQESLTTFVVKVECD